MCASQFVKCLAVLPLVFFTASAQAVPIDFSDLDSAIASPHSLGARDRDELDIRAFESFGWTSMFSPRTTSLSPSRFSMTRSNTRTMSLSRRKLDKIKGFMNDKKDRLFTSVDAQQIPEPSTVLLMLIGVGLLASSRFRRQS